MSAMRGSLQKQERGRLPRLLATAALVLLVAGLWLSASRRGDARPAPGTAAVVAAPVELAPADVAAVELKQISHGLPLSGSLSPLVQTTVKSRVAGEILELTVREGQAVKQGDVLARIDTRYLKAQLDSQQATLEKARADLALAKLNRDNSAVMLKEHFISQNAYDSAESAYQADLANTKAAQAQVALAQLAWSDAVVRAPFSGIVVKRLAQPGERVDVEGSLLTLVDLSRMEFQAAAPASEVPAVKVGQTAHFKVGGFGERLFEGRVERISPMTEEGSRSILLYLSVDNRDGALRGGMFGQGELTLDHSEEAPAVPAAAVRGDNGSSYVIVLADGRLSQRAVSLGRRSEESGYVEVRDGLKPGERVLVARFDNFKDGMSAALGPAAAAPQAAR
ncbi:MAG: efflux RND transporter periplasmic adaptor subunit [Nevskia sp.]|nr:efflux RND transporter periplasmic adaptor subunit [Nevskia sp.]